MTKAIVFSPVNEKEKEEEEKVEEENKHQEEEEGEIRTTMVSSAAMQQSYTHRPRQLFLSSKQ